MPGTFAQKVLARKVGAAEISPGEIVIVSPDVALSHDNTAPIYGLFREMGGERVFDPEMNVIVLDHATPAPTTKHAENHRMIRDFVRDQGLPYFYEVGRGICHQVLVEEGLALPGEVVLGSDSHTLHAGALGAFAAGIGRTEMASIWALGELWLRVPESIKIEVKGQAKRWVTSKDLALQVIGDLGSDGALGMSVEWHGEAIQAMSIGGRQVLTNMMAEMGAKNSFMPPDGGVDAYLQGRAKRAYEAVFPDVGAGYARSFVYDLEFLEPMVARPHRVDNVAPLGQVRGVRIDQAFLGTCTNGRLEDLALAARVLEDRHVAKGTRMIVIPASSQVYLAALKAGYVQTFIEAGAAVLSPGCGPCMGNHMGVPAEGEVTISSANRNFKGRMGTPESEIYLAGPAIVAASAVAGEITHPDGL
jgi:3-isopropylmalate/(R)-2-methylmalate dehydratase large subunit